MTNLRDDNQPTRSQGKVIQRWLSFAFTALALSMPIAGLFLMAWPFLLARTSVTIDSIEVVGSAAVSGLVGIVLASHIRRERGTRL